MKSPNAEPLLITDRLSALGEMIRLRMLRILEREEWLVRRPWVIPPMIRSCIMAYLKEEFRLLLKGPTTWSGK